MQDLYKLKGDANPSLTHSLIEECLSKDGKLTPGHDDLISAVAGMVYAGQCRDQYSHTD